MTLSSESPSALRAVLASIWVSRRLAVFDGALTALYTVTWRGVDGQRATHSAAAMTVDGVECDGPVLFSDITDRPGHPNRRTLGWVLVGLGPSGRPEAGLTVPGRTPRSTVTTRLPVTDETVPPAACRREFYRLGIEN